MKNPFTKFHLLAYLGGFILVALIILVGQFYVHPAFLPDQGPLWYYWKLPEPSLWGRISGWSFFILHLGITLYLALQLKKHPSTEPGKLGKYNWYLIITQIVFTLLHLAQTYLFYDSLAHDTPVWLSQASVIIMLVLMMILLNDRRGLFFGKKIKFPAFVTNTTKLIHGPYIILSLIFTFWYHPMEPSIGHLIGFFYMFLLMSQISFAQTPAHFDRYWQFGLEFIVLIHGTIVAIMTGNGMWPMFAFGFGAVTVITYIYLLNLPKLARLGLQLLYVVMIIIVYTGGFSSNRTFAKIFEITYIPFIEYLLVFVFAGALMLLGKFKKPAA